MAINRVSGGTILRLELQTGVNANGDPVLRNKNRRAAEAHVKQDQPGRYRSPGSGLEGVTERARELRTEEKWEGGGMI